MLDEVQRTPGGLERREPIAMCMVDGSEGTVKAFRRIASGVGYFDGKGKLVQREDDAGGGKGMAVRRRYWFESMGVPIGNLILV